jgi:hypothetical protein
LSLFTQIGNNESGQQQTVLPSRKSDSFCCYQRTRIPKTVLALVGESVTRHRQSRQICRLVSPGLHYRIVAVPCSCCKLRHEYDGENEGVADTGAAIGSYDKIPRLRTRGGSFRRNSNQRAGFGEFPKQASLSSQRTRSGRSVTPRLLGSTWTLLLYTKP